MRTPLDAEYRDATLEDVSVRNAGDAPVAGYVVSAKLIDPDGEGPPETTVGVVDLAAGGENPGAESNCERSRQVD